MKPKSLKRGDTIGVVAVSEPITSESQEDVERSVKLIESLGINVKFSKHAFQNPTGYRGNCKT